MKILKWEFSDLFDKYYERCMSILKEPPKWIFTKVLPAPYDTYQGAYNPNNGDIYLNETMPLHQAEIVAAHELTHASKHLYYPATRTSVEHPVLSHVASKLQSCLQDVDVFKTLDSYGFDISSEMALRANEAKYIIYIHTTSEDFPILPLSFVEYYYYFGSNQDLWSDIVNGYKTHAPDAYSVGKELVELSLATNLDDPLSVESILKDFVSILDLDEYVEIAMPSDFRPELFK